MSWVFCLLLKNLLTFIMATSSSTSSTSSSSSVKVIDEKLDRPSWDALYLRHPFNMLIAGPSGSGKTEFVKRLIEHKSHLFDRPPQRIVWCYKEWQPSYTLLKESQGETISFVEGIPHEDDGIVSDVSQTHLVIFDDMLGEDEEEIKLWFTRKGHHRNASIVYITQNLFQQSKAHRTISLNAHYVVLFKSPRDKSQVQVLAKQLGSPWLNYAYDDATQTPHEYLLIDLKPTTPDYLRFRANIFHHWCEEGGPVIYTSPSIHF